MKDNRENSSEFSRFSPLRDESPKAFNSNEKRKGKSAASKTKALWKKSQKSSGNKKNTSSATGQTSWTPSQYSCGQKKNTDNNAPLLDISKLFSQDILQLREALGIVTETHYAHNEDIHSFLGDSLENLNPNHVEFNPAELSDADGENSRNNRLISTEMRNVPYDREGEIVDDWDLPILKAPEKGNPVSETLVKKINLACI